jgi:hypothetical protein
MADYDAAEMILDILKTSTATGAEDIRDLLVSGAGSIMEARDFDESDVQAADDARRALDEDDQAVALLLTVEDLGDDPSETQADQEVQYVGIRVIDRNRGYSNIRAVRKAIKAWLFTDEAWDECSLDDAGILTLEYGGRSGHAYSPEHAVELEAITVKAKITQMIGTYD